MQVTTSDKLVHDGHRVPYTTLNRVFGITTLSPSAWANYKTKFRNIIGGESKSYVRIIEKSRYIAIQKLENNAKKMGGNAVTCLRFDSDCINGDLETVVAYGTAVYVDAPSNQ